MHRRSLLPGRSSDIRPYNSPSEERDATFVFTIPQPEIPLQLESSPALETTQGGGSAVDEPSPPPSEVQGDDLTINEEVMNSEIESPRLSLGTSETSRYLDNETSIEKVISDTPKKTFRRKSNKLSEHGLKYSSLPLGVIKKHAMTLTRYGARSGVKLSRDTLDAIMQATDWFFEQISDDLGTYSEHAGRKTIDESDVLMLMRRYILRHE